MRQLPSSDARHSTYVIALPAKAVCSTQHGHEHTRCKHVRRRLVFTCVRCCFRLLGTSCSAHPHTTAVTVVEGNQSSSDRGTGRDAPLLTLCVAHALADSGQSVRELPGQRVSSHGRVIVAADITAGTRLHVMNTGAGEFA